MENTKHTPGPWRLRRGYNNQQIMKISGEGWEGFAKVVVRMDTDIDDCEDGLANAKLIAAAPELLEALQRIVTDFKDYPASERPCLAFDLAEQAIKKATE